MEHLAVKDLTFTYPGGTSPAVDSLSFSVERGSFVAVAGMTGSGKSTLLRLLKRELSPRGTQSGSVLLGGIPADSLDPADAASRIGFVAQRPEEQVVTDRVWHELAFGLENLGLPSSVIRRRVAETAAFFGIGDWFEKNTSELSGGQLQLLSLASVTVMGPSLLLLDEPTAQLDPIAAENFVAAVKKLSRELSVTVLFAEHRLDRILPVSDKLLVLEKGRLASFGDTRPTVSSLLPDQALIAEMPAPVRLYARLGGNGPCPLDVREGRDLLLTGGTVRLAERPEEERRHDKTPALAFRGVWFRYDRSEPDVLRDLSFTVETGETLALLGGNGSGKSTALAAAAGLLRPHAGEIRVFGEKITSYRNQSLYRNCLSLLPQDVQTVFLADTVRAELRDVDTASLPFDVTPWLDRHPYDLSGGEAQLVALAKVLATRPKLLLLDEPTKGLDAGMKEELLRIFRELKAGGVSILLVTHDVEFAASAADRCGLFFRGEAISCEETRRFFSENAVYTTSVARMAGGILPGAVTVEDIVTDKKGGVDG